MVDTKNYWMVVLNSTKVLRVERKNDADEISGKVADFTEETVKRLIEKGEHDALELFESKY